MKTSSQLLLTFLFNAVWQIALIAALASFGAWLLRRSAMRFQHWLWVAALCLSLLVSVFTAVKALPDSSSPVVGASYERQLTSPFASDPITPFLERTPATFSKSVGMHSRCRQVGRARQVGKGRRGLLSRGDRG